MISPDETYAYRDSGLPADELCRRVVAGAAAHLDEGGFAHVLVSWALGGRRRLGRAAAGVGRRERLRRVAPPLPDERPGRARRRLAAAARRDRPGRVRGGARPLARPSPPARDRRGRLRRGRAPAPERRRQLAPRRPAPARPARARERAHAARVRGTGLLERLDGDGLLALPLALTAAHRLDQALVARDGALRVESQTLELTEGLRFTVGVDRHTASLLRWLDGRRPLREVLDLARETFELEPDERERFVPAALPVVRRLLELGFLEPS